MMINRDGGWLGTLRWLENRSHAAPIGQFFAPSQETFQLHASTRLAFPAHAIESTRQDSKRIQIVSPLFGLSGPVAALPYTYTEQLVKAKRESGTALPAFFDIFNHRAQSLLYRALRKHRYVLGKERAQTTGEQDSYSSLMAALGGVLDIDAGDNHAAGITTSVAPRDALAGFAGLLARRARSASGLAQMLQRYFGLDIRIRQFAGRRVCLDQTLQNRIGIHHSNNNQLGSCLLGRRSWQATAFFCVEIHHPDARQFAALKPDGALLHALHTMVRRYAGEEFGFHIEIFTGPALQTSARLRSGSKIMNEDSTTRLGWCGVLGRAETSAGAVIKIGRLRYPAANGTDQPTPVCATR